MIINKVWSRANEAICVFVCAYSTTRRQCATRIRVRDRFAGHYNTYYYCRGDFFGIIIIIITTY
jgi:hypothetical protein